MEPAFESPFFTHEELVFLMQDGSIDGPAASPNKPTGAPFPLRGAGRRAPALTFEVDIQALSDNRDPLPLSYLVPQG
jgi:hypothetical protein